MKFVTILGLIALLMGGFIYFYLFGGSPDEEQQSGVTDAQEQAEQTLPADVVVRPESGVSTLDTLRFRGENLECEITYTPAETESESKVEGTYFVSDGNMRGDFLTDAPDLSGQVLSSMIVAGDTMYYWSEIEGEAYGIKMDTSLLNDTEVKTNEPVGLDVDVKYTCKDWESVDRTVFVPPSEVLFQDMSTLMQSGMEYGTVYEGEMEMPF